MDQHMRSSVRTLMEISYIVLIGLSIVFLISFHDGWNYNGPVLGKRLKTFNTFRCILLNGMHMVFQQLFHNLLKNTGPR